MKAKTYINIPAALGFLLLPLSGAASDGSESVSYFSNPLFNTLLIVIILLLIVNVVLSQALKNIAQSDYIVKKLKENKDKTNSAGTLVLFFLFLSNNSEAQNIVTKRDWQVGGLDMWTFYFMFSVILLEVIVMTILLRLIKSALRSDVETKREVVVKENIMLKKLTGAVAIEEENEILLDHDYDGIRELDNDLPPWWKYGFYLTIIVSIVYLIHYHVAHTGNLQLTEYNNEIEKGKQEVAEFMKNAANNVDESSVKMLEGSDIESGKQLFISTCAACHGKLGEGGVGPNLTDPYWVHGGSIQDIFKSVKYGWADKGMKSWKEDLSPVQIAQISSFIRTISGTNPPNGKAPQGDLYKEEIAAADSLTTDSIKIQVDTLKVAASTK
jgi:cytochrome c oxidase cbb3-type subunit 3